MRGTRKICRVEAKNLIDSRHQKIVDKEGILPAKDVWGNELRYRYEVDDYSIMAVVTSSGADGIEDTEDDIAGSSTIKNTTKIIGRWIGERSKEFGEGLVDGINDPKDFKGKQEPEVEEKDSWWDKLKGKFSSEEEE